MSFIRRRDRLGRVILLGTGRITTFSDGMVLRVSSPSIYGDRCYSFRVCSAAVRRTDGTYKRNVVSAIIWDDHPQAEEVRHYHEGDMIFLFGIESKQSKISNITGGRKTFSSVKIEYVTRYGKGQESLIEEDAASLTPRGKRAVGQKSAATLAREAKEEEIQTEEVEIDEEGYFE